MLKFLPDSSDFTSVHAFRTVVLSSEAETTLPAADPAVVSIMQAKRGSRDENAYIS